MSQALVLVLVLVSVPVLAPGLGLRRALVHVALERLPALLRLLPSARAPAYEQALEYAQARPRSQTQAPLEPPLPLVHLSLHMFLLWFLPCALCIPLPCALARLRFVYSRASPPPTPPTLRHAVPSLVQVRALARTPPLLAHPWPPPTPPPLLLLLPPDPALQPSLPFPPPLPLPPPLAPLPRLPPLPKLAYTCTPSRNGNI